MIKYVIIDKNSNQIYCGHTMLWSLTGSYGFNLNVERARLFDTERAAKNQIGRFKTLMGKAMLNNPPDKQSLLCQRDLFIISIEVTYKPYFSI